MNGTYGGYIYTDTMIKVIENAARDESKTPFFVYLAFQNCHAPLEVTSKYVVIQIFENPPNYDEMPGSSILHRFISKKFANTIQWNDFLHRRCFEEYHREIKQHWFI